MNGAECLLRTLLASRVDTCFMNPGTSEMQFVAALDRVPAMRGILCLFEGVCAGAADGYARMLHRPAATLLHLGPGLGNAISNLHNARKARVPVVNLVGQHSTQHLKYDAPLTADIEGIARPVSAWVRTVEHAADMGRDTAAAVHAACTPPGQVASLIVPADFSWSDGGDPGEAIVPQARAVPDCGRIRAVTDILRSGEPAGFLLGGTALLGAALHAAGQVAARTGARVFAGRYLARMEAGGGRYSPPRLPYFPEPAEAALAGLKHLILVESPPPISFFGYPNRRSYLAPDDCAVHVLAALEEDGAAALHELALQCGAPACVPPAAAAPPAALPEDGPLTLEAIGRTLAVLMPGGSIISEEAVSSGEAVLRQLSSAARFDHLPVTGGSIGQGLPVAVGAAVACPGRKVIALEADGSGMYSLQALWTMARERLDVTTVVFSNRRYRILDIEMQRTGAGTIGPAANDMLDLRRPDLDWVKLSEGQGVEAARAGTAGEFVALFRRAMDRPGPFLIEAVV
jgi:acetolactate synthase I/II/III large subunit